MRASPWGSKRSGGDGSGTACSNPSPDATDTTADGATTPDAEDGATTSDATDAALDGNDGGCPDPERNNLVCCNFSGSYDSHRPTCRDGRLVCDRSGYSMTESLFCEPGPDATTSDAGDGSDSPPIPDPEVRFRPRDGATGTDGEFIGLEIHYPKPLDATKLQTLADHVSLVTWPDRTSVPADVTTTPSNADASIQTNATIRLHPESPLSPDWHALKVDSLPDGWDWPDTHPTQQLSSGARVTRFRPDSHPYVNMIGVVDKRTEYKVDVVFTERVSTHQTTISSAVTVSQTDGAGCSLISPNNSTFENLPYKCPGLDPNQTLTVEVADDAFISPDGAKVPGKTFEFVPDQQDVLGNDHGFRYTTSYVFPP